MFLKAIDHFVMTCADVEATVRFYSEALGVPVNRENGRVSVQFGTQKINLHQSGREIDPHAAKATPGAIDVCFLTDASVNEIQERLDQHGIEIELGPVTRAGAQGPMTSIYLRDPDGNLVEISRLIAE